MGGQRVAIPEQKTRPQWRQWCLLRLDPLTKTLVQPWQLATSSSCCQRTWETQYEDMNETISIIYSQPNRLACFLGLWEDWGARSPETSVDLCTVTTRKKGDTVSRLGNLDYPIHCPTRFPDITLILKAISMVNALWSAMRNFRYTQFSVGGQQHSHTSAVLYDDDVLYYSGIKIYCSWKWPGHIQV